MIKKIIGPNVFLLKKEKQKSSEFGLVKLGQFNQIMRVGSFLVIFIQQRVYDGSQLFTVPIIKIVPHTIEFFREGVEHRRLAFLES
jgi:hypothetical protein